MARKMSRRALVPLMVMQTLDSSSVGMRWCHISAIFCLRGGSPAVVVYLFLPSLIARANASTASSGGWKSGSPSPNCTASSPAMSNILLTPVGRMLFERSENLTMTCGLAS